MMDVTVAQHSSSKFPSSVWYRSSVGWWTGDDAQGGGLVLRALSEQSAVFAIVVAIVVAVVVVAAEGEERRKAVEETPVFWSAASAGDDADDADVGGSITAGRFRGGVEARVASGPTRSDEKKRSYSFGDGSFLPLTDNSSVNKL
jgi:hypothetical protein